MLETKIQSAHRTTLENRLITTQSKRSVERRPKSITQEETLPTTRTTWKWKSATACLPCAKYQRIANILSCALLLVLQDKTM